MTDDLGRGGLRDRNQIVRRDHRARVGAHVELLDVFGLRPEGRVRLYIDTVGAVVEVKVVHVRRSHVDAESVSDLRQRDVQALGFLAIDGDQVLRIAGAIGGEQTGQILALFSLPDQGMRNLIEFLQGVSTQVLDLELKAAEFTQPLNRGRQEGNHNRSGNSEELAPNPGHDGIGGVFDPLALRIRSQGNKNQPAIGRAPSEAEAGHGKGALGLWHLGHDGVDLLADLLRVIQRRS